MISNQWSVISGRVASRKVRFSNFEPSSLLTSLFDFAQGGEPLEPQPPSLLTQSTNQLNQPNQLFLTLGIFLCDLSAGLAGNGFFNIVQMADDTPFAGGGLKIHDGLYLGSHRTRRELILFEVTLEFG